jgi:threonine synthase
LELLKRGVITLDRQINLIVPSGNFGNVLGAYYAKKMGLPIAKMIVASNKNNVLSELINKGIYDIRDKKLIKTISPAMDILKSSNVERVLFDMFGSDRVRELMNSLEKEGKYELNNKELEMLQKDFSAIYSEDEEVLSYIKKYAKKGYIMDTHTATTIKAYEHLTNQDEITVAFSTAQWTKFATSIYKALNNKVATSDKDAIVKISKQFNIKVSPQINNLFDKKIIHNKVIDKQDIMKETVEFL